MRMTEVPGWLRETLLRLFPHATRPGLRRIGRPEADSPVLVTGNFALTVRRLTEVLRGRDAWLLVANSRGINVWCAATGGHLTDHDVIAVLRASSIGELVSHRKLVLPQLSATGIERRRIAEATGWDSQWGPARLEDLPQILDRGGRVSKKERWMRFPLWERLEMAFIWAPPMAAMAWFVLGLVVDWQTGAVAAVVTLAVVLALFAALPWLRVTGTARWLTYGAFAVAGFAIGAGALFALGGMETTPLVGLGVASVATLGILSLDLTGTTPWYPGTVSSLGNRFELELVEGRCNGEGECVQVCPREVLVMIGGQRNVSLAHGDDCVLCGACIVQCRENALRFRFADGRIVEPSTVRSTRVNLLGRRTVQVGGGTEPGKS